MIIYLQTIATRLKIITCGGCRADGGIMPNLLKLYLLYIIHSYIS